ncbi:MAG TPA: DNA polymerase/3'-5' exonuclease PolX [bacterium]|nr:DNA polymerase/3'-5' exonuclease PolX [bacterium]
MTRTDVVAVLYEISELLELTGENPFKVRAYQNAARSLEGRSEAIEDLIASGKLGELPGIGEHIREKITILVNEGRLKYYEDLKKKIPHGLLEMIRIPGLGPKKARSLYEHLKVDTVEKLEKACRDGKVAQVEGFGEKSAQKILEGIEHAKKYSERHLYDEAWTAAQGIVSKLRKRKDVQKCEIAGSLRRCRETIGDVDILVSSKAPGGVMDYFTRMPEVETVLSKGETKSSVSLKENGLQVDLRVIAANEFPFALHYFTGSKEHNILMRQRAQSMAMKLNEYGLFKEEKGGKETRIPCESEEGIFRTLDLDYIPPELREAQGEIEAAERHKIPRLVEEKDIRGVFHVHSNWSDGTATLEEMIAEAENEGLEYVGISDHSQTAKYAHGMDPERVLKQEKEIDKLRKKFKIRIFWGIESDILADGSLDYRDDLLERFDFVIASVHSSFTMPEKEMTARIVKALKNKFTTMLGHATGRLLLSREAYRVDMKKVIDVAGGQGKAIEINAHPYRFDLDWRLGPYAKDKGVKVSINPDAHALNEIRYYKYGVGIARKAWMTKSDVITAMTLGQIEKYLERTT